MANDSDDLTLTNISVHTSSSSIGPYRLVQMLGVGGMGEVWRAEQTAPFHRTVALKLIKVGMDTRAVVARFESERQALALMEHPNIAKVFDAGATPEGRPFFVMEYVPGLPITTYCDKHCLTIKERLALFTQVCEGVQHAHQKAIIHRDLKPSNVLVGELDQKPVPKIIDFGLAKATGPRLSQATMYTEVGGIVGTPDYMSPEQADSTERNIDTRTDVYSLGVILYELLVGALPFSSREMRGEGTPAMLHKIRAQEPMLPSTKFKSLDESSKDSAAKRREQPQALRRHLRGEPDWITMKALEKDRTRRYGSPSELAADINRYVKNEPVLAGPPSTSYRAGKFVRRHRFGVGVAVAVALLLIGFATTMALQARRIAKERDRANREAAASKRVADFMTRMFKVSDPSEARGNAVTAREILDKASKEIETGLANDPELQARLLYVMGDTYEGLGLFSGAESLLARSLDVRRRVLGPQNPDTLASMNDLGEAIWRQARYPEAEKLVHEALDGRHRTLGPNHPATLASMNNLGLLLTQENRYAEAEKLFRQLLDTQRRTVGPSDDATLNAEVALANVLANEGRGPEAEKLYQDAADGWRRLYGVEHPSTLRALADLAICLDVDGHYAEAEKLHREAIEIKNRVLGPEHPHTLLSRSSLGLTLFHEGRYAEAEKMDRETLEAERRVFGPEHPETLSTLSYVADTLVREHRYSDAEKLRVEVLTVRRRVLGPEDPDTLLATGSLGITLTYEKEFAKAENLFQEALQVAQRSSDKGPLAAAWYSFACGAAVAGYRDRALEYLGKAADNGSQDVANMANDEDLKSLRRDPRFTALIAQAKTRAAVQATN
jgi:eukaryotic-like serine/threonine-protein kinase